MHESENGEIVNSEVGNDYFGRSNNNVIDDDEDEIDWNWLCVASPFVLLISVGWIIYIIMINFGHFHLFYILY